MNQISSLKNFLLMPRDKTFTSKLLKLMIPMALQQLMQSCVFIFDTIIVGGLGDEYLAASGQAGHLIMLMWCGLYGASSAGSIYAAQYWGKDKDVIGVRKAFTTTVLFGAIIAIPFFIFGFFFREQAMLILSKDPLTRQIGEEYLSIVSFSFLFWMISSMFASMLRSVGITRIPMIASGISIAINVAMDSVIVYGFLGFPKWGIKGAAFSTVIGSVVELAVLLIFARRAKAPVAMRRKDFVKPEKDLLKKFVRAAIPLMAQNQLWAAGVTVYSICFSYLGVAASAAYNAYGTLGELMNLVFISVGGAGGIMIGHILGAGEIERAKNYSWRLLRIILLSGILLAPVFFLLKDVLLLPFPNLSDQTIAYARQALMMISLVIWARGINFTNMNGILRSGGDTLGAAAIDIGMLWLYGVPLALLVSYYLHLPFWVLFAVVCSEEVIKVFISVARVRKYKWAKRLV